MQELIKKKLFESALKIIPFEGWGPDLLVKAERAVNLPEGIASVLFPSGINDFFEYYIEEIDREMLSVYKDSIGSNLKVHQRIRQCIISRIEVLVRNKSVAARALAFLAMPINYALSLRTLWKTVDLIWYEAGRDQSTDFNYYTKRGLLAGVYSSTILYWINDESENFTETVGFLDRRLEDVHKIYKAKEKFAGVISL
ncbi:MAG: COQ9 family protein [Candidatus Midichloria sp.]|uniref:Ubiquinone biosynthesis protein n=1 Tax=Hyalomma marginatum TaxID=34627 RepID=A0A8S4C4X5_9ACAR|nr:COQ9 family protein [Hyalomma marginatum]CAG7594743.1 COQ9 family protein [Hyalomma marginatum]